MSALCHFYVGYLVAIRIKTALSFNLTVPEVVPGMDDLFAVQNAKAPTSATVQAAKLNHGLLRLLVSIFGERFGFGANLTSFLFSRPVSVALISFYSSPGFLHSSKKLRDEQITLPSEPL